MKLYGAEAGSNRSEVLWGVSAWQDRGGTMKNHHSVEHSENLSFFGVYSGHRGTEAVKFVTDKLHGNFFGKKDGTIREQLKSAFLKTDTEFLSENPYNDSGTTAVVGIVDTRTDKLSIANTGDSRAIVVRNEEVLWATKDHKPGEELEKKRIEKAGGVVFENKVGGHLKVSRAIGDGDLKEFVIPDPYVSDELFFNEKDTLVLASSSVWDVMDNEEVAKFVSQRLIESGDVSSPSTTNEEMVNEQLQSVARNLQDRVCELAKKNSSVGNIDNVTVLIVKLGLFLEIDQPAESVKASILKQTGDTLGTHEEADDVEGEFNAIAPGELEESDNDAKFTKVSPNDSGEMTGSDKNGVHIENNMHEKKGDTDDIVERASIVESVYPTDQSTILSESKITTSSTISQNAEEEKIVACLTCHQEGLDCICNNDVEDADTANIQSGVNESCAGPCDNNNARTNQKPESPTTVSANKMQPDGSSSRRKILLFLKSIPKQKGIFLSLGVGVVALCYCLHQLGYFTLGTAGNAVP